MGKLNIHIVHPLKQREDYCCVYKFTLDNGEFYIGGAKSFRRRISQHRKNFLSSNCNTRFIPGIGQSKQIVFEVIEIVKDISSRREREDFYIKLFWGNEKLINRAYNSIGGFKRTDEEREKHRQAALKVKWTPERRIAHKALMKEVMSRPGYVCHLSLIPRNKKKVAVFDLHNNYIKTYDSYRDASKELGIGLKQIQGVLSGLQRQSKGYILRDVDENGGIIEPPEIKKFPRSNIPVNVNVFDMDGNMVGSYRSIRDAEKSTGVHSRTIRKIFIGFQKTANGFTFKRDLL